MKNSIYQLQATKPNGQKVNLSDYQGKVIMIVNTASKCGFTPQFEKLEDLYKEFKAEGFEILGFPSNDFAGQEPNSAEEAAQFCQINYGVSFPIMDKVHVKRGEDQDALFKFLGDNAPGPKMLTHPKWNFQKYLIDKNGNVVDYYLSTTDPSSDKVKSKVKELLKQ